MMILVGFSLFFWFSSAKADVFIEASCHQECIGFIQEPLAVYMDCKRRCEQQKYKAKEIEQNTQSLQMQQKEQEKLEQKLQEQQIEIEYLEKEQRELKTQDEKEGTRNDL